MSEILVRRRHGLRLADAKRLAESMARRLRDDFGGSYEWDGDTLRFRRTGASGHIAVSREDFEIRVSLSFLLGPLHGRIEREILTFCDEHAGRPAPAPAPARSSPARRSRSTGPSRSHGASRSERPK
jgi:putative polyhydroxyalkanoate system protein